MPWSYEAPERDSGYIDGNVQLSWRNHWTVTELSPTVPGYIRLQIALFTDDFFTIPSGYQWYFTDKVSLGSTSITVHERYTAPLEYSVEVQIPSSWSGQVVKFDIAGRIVNISVDAAAVYQLSITAGSNSQIEVYRSGSSLSDGSAISAGDELLILFQSSPGYVLTVHQVNGVEFASGNTHIVSGNVSIVSEATVTTYSLLISQGNNTSVLVNRTRSPAGAAQGYLNNGATLYHGDEITVSYSVSTGYSIGVHELNGADFSSGVIIVVADSVSIATTATLNTYTVTLDADEHLTISIQRTSSPLGGGSIGQIVLPRDAIYHGDVLVVSAIPDAGYGVESMSVNSRLVSSPYTITVVSALLIEATGKILGFLYIDSGSAIEKYKILIDSGSAMDQYRAMIDTGAEIVPY